MTHKQRFLLLLFILCTLLCSISVFAQTVNMLYDPTSDTLRNSIHKPPSTGTWKQVATLAASDGEYQDQFGLSVSASGNTAVVGAPSANGGTGAAYVFVKSTKSGASITQLAELTASDGSPGDGFGVSVAVSGDTIVIGAVAHSVGPNPQQGAAYVFVEPVGGWTDMTENAELTASDGTSNDWLGNSVAIDGGTVAAGAPQTNNGGPGATYIFLKPANGWADMTQTAKLTASDGRADLMLGLSVGVTSNTVVSASDSNAAYVFVEPPSGWVDMNEAAKLSASAHTVLMTVSISSNAIAAGADLASVNGEKGAVFVFVKPKSGWSSTSKANAELTASNGQVFDELGYSVSIDGNTIVAGAPNAPCHLVRGRCNPLGPGAAYVFVKPASGWKNATETAELMSTGGQAGDQFGVSVANIGSTVLAGAPIADSVHGAAYVFGHVSSAGASVEDSIIP
jgi:hypothetical protein